MKMLYSIQCTPSKFTGNYFYIEKSIEIRIQHVASLGNRKIKLLARTRMQGVRRCEIYVLRACPTLIILVDDFVAKLLRQKLVQLGQIFVKLRLSMKN